MQKEFGYPKFDKDGKCSLTYYSGEYSDMLMDIFVKKMSKGETLDIFKSGEETAVLLLNGTVEFCYDGKVERRTRTQLTVETAWCLHTPCNTEIAIKSIEDCEVLVQSTHNIANFPAKMYGEDNITYFVSGEGLFGGKATRTVSTFFDYNTAPYSNMVMGEIFNDEGSWSSFIPHHHPQPEVYYFKFDRPEGFGASFVGDNVYKITHGSFSAIPGGVTHPQVAAPCYKMYTCWMIRHLDGNPWTDRIDDERYTWLLEGKK